MLQIVTYPFQIINTFFHSKRAFLRLLSRFFKAFLPDLQKNAAVKKLRRCNNFVSFLHIRLNGRDQNIASYHPVLGGEALGKIIGIENLGIGRKLIIPLPHKNLHLIPADHR